MKILDPSVNRAEQIGSCVKKTISLDVTDPLVLRPTGAWVHNHHSKHFEKKISMVHIVAISETNRLF